MIRSLYFLSKTDVTVVKHCPPVTRNIQATLGFFVLLTGTMAFFSGTYAISNMFVVEDTAHGPTYMENAWLYSSVLGTLYAIFIMAIDREIVSAVNKLAVMLRLPLAVIISLIISTPMEMKLFDARLIELINKNNIEDNRPLADTLAINAQRARKKYDELLHRRDGAIKERDHWGLVMQMEVSGNGNDGIITHKAGKGPAYDQAEQNQKRQQEIIDLSTKELEPVTKEVERADAAQDTKYEAKRIHQSFDLLTKYIALGEIKRDDKTGSANKMSWGITVLFFLFETIPCIIKLLLPKTEYDNLTEKRRLLNNLTSDMIYEGASSEYYSKNAAELQEENPLRVDEMFLSQSN